jgi:hypothetical protein
MGKLRITPKPQLPIPNANSQLPTPKALMLGMLGFGIEIWDWALALGISDLGFGIYK